MSDCQEDIQQHIQVCSEEMQAATKTFDDEEVGDE